MGDIRLFYLCGCKRCLCRNFRVYGRRDGVYCSNRLRSARIVFLALSLYKLIEFFFRKTSWTFARGEARFRTVLLLRARTAHHELTGWSSLAAQVIEAERNYAQELELDCDPKKVRNYYNGESLWQLVFLNAVGEQLVAIDKLSKPEALWMADVLIREQRAIL